MTNRRPSEFLDLLSGYFTSYLPDAVGASSNTIKSYKYAFRLLLQFMHDKKGITADSVSFESLDHDTIMSFLDWLENERGCCASTKNQRLAALTAFSEYAQNRNFEAASVFRNGLVKIPSKKSNHPPRAVFTVGEVQILLAMPDDSSKSGRRDRVLLSFMYASGARAQEVCDLRVCDVLFPDDKHTIVILHGKGGKVRRIGIPQACGMLLRKYMIFLRIHDNPQRHVFSSQNNEHMSVSCIEEIFKKYISAAREQHPDLFREKSYPPHSMRHTTASHMLEAGVPLVVIKNFLGHASIQSTQIYAELSQETVDKNLKEWNEKWFSHAGEETVETRDSIPDFLSVK